MNIFSNRIESLYKALGFANLNEFALALGYKAPEKLYRLGRTATAKPSVDILEDISNKFENANIHFLLTGKGEPVNVLKSYPVLADKPDIILDPPETHYANIIKIPVINIVAAAGSGALNGDHIEVLNTITLPQSMISGRGRVFAIMNRGESMAPTLQDGGYMIISEVHPGNWKSIKEERIYTIVSKDGLAWNKRVKNRLKNGFLVLKSDNPDKATYPNFNINAEELHSVWYAEWYLSAKMPNIHDQYYTRLQHLEDEFDEFRKLLGK